MSSSLRWCVVGLGNYGAAYHPHRHNIGYRCVEQLAQIEGLAWRRGRKMDYCLSSFGLLLCRPRLFINQSGELWPFLRSTWRFSSGQLIVIVDNLDLSPGTIRLRQNGGTAGHNGLRSLVGWIGSGDFARICLGIGRPASREQVVEYVLGTPPPEERLLLDGASTRVVEALQKWGGSTWQQLASLLSLPPG